MQQEIKLFDMMQPLDNKNFPADLDNKQAAKVEEKAAYVAAIKNDTKHEHGNSEEKHKER